MGEGQWMEWRIVGSRMVVGVGAMIDEKWSEKVTRRLTRTLMRLVLAFGIAFFFYTAESVASKGCNIMMLTVLEALQGADPSTFMELAFRIGFNYYRRISGFEGFRVSRTHDGHCLNVFRN